MSDDQKFSRRELLGGGIFRRIASAASKAADASMAGLLGDSTAEPSQSVSHSRTGSFGRGFVLPIHRPPGAIHEVAFLAECTRCNDCISACPVSAIIHAPNRLREAAGTPMIDAASTACIFCHDTPCISACKPGVLNRAQPLKMGVAWIQTMACLAHTGSFCSVCSERCPVTGAIAVLAGKPTIVADLCVGCGVCAAVCPAPINAVVVMPLADRPRLETGIDATRNNALPKTQDDSSSAPDCA